MYSYAAYSSLLHGMHTVCMVLRLCSSCGRSPQGPRNIGGVEGVINGKNFWE